MTRKRQEFSRAVKVAIKRRAMRATGYECECCGAIVAYVEIDHRNPDALQVEKRKLTEAEGWAICEPCHDRKTRGDVRQIAKAKRQEACYLGVRKSQARRIQNRGFEPVEKSIPSDRLARVEKPTIPDRRLMFEEK